MKSLINKLLNNKEVLLYLVFGVLTTAVNFVVYTFFTRFLILDELISNLFAWVFAVSFAYVTNKKYVFSSKTTSIKQLTKEMSTFFIARLFSLGVDMIIMFIGLRILFIYDIYVKLFSQIVIVILNYVLSKFIIFKKEDNNA